MTDLEMIKLCEEAMGWHHKARRYGMHIDPLHDDAQAMAMVKKIGVTIGYDGLGKWTVEWWPAHQSLYPAYSVDSLDLNRAIVECVAKMQAGK